MHGGSSKRVPGDDERRFDVVHDERHRNKLSGGESVSDWEYCSGRRNHVHLQRRIFFGYRHDRHRWYSVHFVRRQQLLEHGGCGRDELHSVHDGEYCGCRCNHVSM